MTRRCSKCWAVFDEGFETARSGSESSPSVSEQPVCFCGPPVPGETDQTWSIETSLWTEGVGHSSLGFVAFQRAVGPSPMMGHRPHPQVAPPPAPASCTLTAVHKLVVCRSDLCSRSVGFVRLSSLPVLSVFLQFVLLGSPDPLVIRKIQRVPRLEA